MALSTAPVHFASAASRSLPGMANIRVAMQRITLELPLEPGLHGAPSEALLHASESVLGHVEMMLDVLENVEDGVLRFHALGLSVLHARLRSVDQEAWFEPLTDKYEAEEEYVALLFERRLPLGKYLLVMRFTGLLQVNDRPCGLFPITYRTKSSSAIGYGTQCEPCDARRIFPCIDEPNARCAFQLSLIVPPSFTAVSNTPIERKETLILPNEEGALAKGAAETTTFATSADDAVRQYNENELAVCHGLSTLPDLPGSRLLTRWTFAPTAPMSPYLLAFMIAEFEVLTNDVDLMHGTIPVEVLTHVGRREAGKYVLEHTVRTLQFYEEKLHVGYTWPKLSVVAMEEAPMLGEENWGCIVLASDFLHVDANTLFSRVQRITRLVAHEVGHMWFGNLVSIRSWEALWLKEGFARFLEYCYVDTVEPTWTYWEHFLIAIFNEAMARDARGSTHPIQSVVGRAREVSEVFDVISYGKGASIIRMIFAYLTPTVGWATISKLIQEAQGTSITAHDLWRAFAATSELDVPAIVNTWINYSHYPIITVSIVSGDENATKLELTQRVAVEKGQSIQSAALVDKATGLSNYIIPLIAKANSGDVTRAVMRESTSVIEISHVVKPTWIKLNWENTGFYRVFYPLEMLEALIEASKRDELPTLDRIGLLLDTIFFVTNEQLPLKWLVLIIASFQGCQSNNVWPVVIKELRAWLAVSKDTDSLQLLSAFICRLCEPLATSLGWFTPSYTNEELQVSVLLLLEDAHSAAWIAASRTCEAPSSSCWLTWLAARFADGDERHLEAALPKLKADYLDLAATPLLKWTHDLTNNAILDALLECRIPKKSVTWFLTNGTLRAALWPAIVERLVTHGNHVGKAMPDDHVESSDLLVQWFREFLKLANTFDTPEKEALRESVVQIWNEQSPFIDDADLHIAVEKFASNRAEAPRSTRVEELVAALRAVLA